MFSLIKRNEMRMRTKAELLIEHFKLESAKSKEEIHEILNEGYESRKTWFDRWLERRKKNG